MHGPLILLRNCTTLCLEGAEDEDIYQAACTQSSVQRLLSAWEAREHRTSPLREIKPPKLSNHIDRRNILQYRQQHWLFQFSDMSTRVYNPIHAYIMCHVCDGVMLYMMHAITYTLSHYDVMVFLAGLRLW